MKKAGSIVMIVAVIGIIIFSKSIVLSQKNTIVAKIQEKERVVTGSGNSIESKYLIFTDKGVFENSDEALLGKFNSSDIYGSLKIGSTYKLTVYGYRIQFLSMYQNIESYAEVK